MSDQGREFINSINEHFFKLAGVKHIISSAYHPQTNGLVERFNQTLQRSLLKMVKDNATHWEKYLDSVLFAYRTSKQASTKYSPFFLLYGREPKLPVDLIVDEKKSVMVFACMGLVICLYVTKSLPPHPPYIIATAKYI